MKCFIRFYSNSQFFGELMERYLMRRVKRDGIGERRG